MTRWRRQRTEALCGAAVGTLVVAGAAGMAQAGCGPASGGDPDFWAPVGRLEGDGGATGTGESAGGGGAGSGGAGTAGTGTASPSAQPQMTLAFTTVSFNGEYAPKNVGAVWVEDAGGSFVKTLEVWGKKRLKYAEKWLTASGGSTVDAVTGATRTSHGPHEIEWDLRGLDGQVVPDGAYHLVLEFTEQNGPGAWTVADLEKGPAPFEGAPEDTPYFTGQHVSFDPGL